MPTEKMNLEASYFGKNGKKFEPKSEAEAEQVLADLKKSDFIIRKVKRSEKQRKAYPPFTTSTLQQDAARKLGFTTKKTMMIAQGLYEGVKINESETVGLITYMRTDSTRISNEAQEAAKAFIAGEFGRRICAGQA